MEKNQKEEIDFNQKITSQGRRKWRRITRRQQEWLLKTINRMYMEEVSISHQPLKSAKRQRIIDKLFEMIRERRIFISKGEISRIADYKMRKWNKHILEQAQQLQNCPDKHNKKNVKIWKDHQIENHASS